MARPQKDGLDYFPLDVDIDQDDKMVLIEATHGMVGFAVVIKLFMKIYKQGYFYDWTEKEQLLFSKRVNIPLKELAAIVSECMKWNLFDREKHDEHRILTSPGIQLRYVKAKSKKKNLKLIKEYLTIDIDELIQVNSEITLIDSEISTQSKVKERKGKESNNPRVNSPSSNQNGELDYQAIKDMFNVSCTNLSNIRDVTEKRKRTLKAWGDPAEMEEVFTKAGKSDFLSGINDRNWKASFDWIIKPENRVKILEGNYDSQLRPSEPKQKKYKEFTDE